MKTSIGGLVSGPYLRKLNNSTSWQEIGRVRAVSFHKEYTSISLSAKEPLLAPGVAFLDSSGLVLAGVGIPRNTGGGRGMLVKENR